VTYRDGKRMAPAELGENKSMPVPIMSVVMSVFQGERYLSQAIDSILGQTFRDFEFIIIDDGSTDDSGSILESHRRSDSRVRVYSQKNNGLIYSLNRGCELARGQYIARMDADDIAARNRLGSQLYYMQEHPAVGVLGSAVEFIDQTGRTLRISRNPLGNADLQRALIDSDVLFHPAVVMRKDAFVSVGGYRNVVHAEDYDLWLRIAESYELANLPEVLLKYRIHSAQISMRTCRQQALSTIAAQAFALERRNGMPDPLTSMTAITSESLTEIGVTKAAQERSIARGYLRCIRNLCRAGEEALALELVDVLGAFDAGHVERWVLADLRLWEARLYWRRRRVVRSMISAARAVITRPVLIGRPLASFSRWSYWMLQSRKSFAEGNGRQVIAPVEVK
jgi:cellulose synthase/poly-beta-1,6-N-acetylglucosamine synthase-like glycosyltransferase